MDLSTKEACYTAGVDTFEKLGVRLKKAQFIAGDLIPIFEAANGHAMMGALQTGKMIAKAKALAGLVAQAEVLKWELHREATDVAIQSGVEVGVLGGGPR